MSLLDKFLHLSTVKSHILEGRSEHFKLNSESVSLARKDRYSTSDLRSRRRRTGIAPLPIETLARTVVLLGKGFISG